jgi:hypothetical protein
MNPMSLAPRSEVKWPGKAWIDAHPVQAAEIFYVVMGVCVVGYLFGALYVIAHFVSKYW